MPVNHSVQTHLTIRGVDGTFGSEVAVLLQYGMIVSPKEYAKDVCDEFIRAVLQNDLKAIVRSLKAGRDPNLPDQYGWIALHRAAAEHRDRIAGVLVEAGSSLSAGGTEGWTPSLAAVSHSERVVEILLRAGADINSQSSHGDTPLHLCVMPENVDAVLGLRAPWLLLSAGANTGLKNNEGLTALEKAKAAGAKRVENCIRRHSKQQILS